MKIVLSTLLSCVATLLTPLAHGQVLGQPAPVRQQIEVTQFGHAADRQFVVCAHADDCDAPLRKTLASQAPSSPPAFQVPVAQALIKPIVSDPASARPLALNAKHPTVTKSTKKRIRAKRKGQCPCVGTSQIPTPR